MWGYRGWQSLPLPKFVVELDQRFITELSSIAVTFTELFEQNGRGRLVQVRLFSGIFAGPRVEGYGCRMADSLLFPAICSLRVFQCSSQSRDAA